MVDKHLREAINLLDKASDKLSEAREDKEKRYMNAYIVKLEQKVLEIRAEIQAFNEMRKEIKNL